MKLSLSVLVAFFIVSSIQAGAAKLPDACGDDKVKFDIKLQANPPAPLAPEPGKAQIFFIESSKKPMALGCMGRCGNFTRMVWTEPGWARPKTTPTLRCR
jgi:hypothetical protein